MTSRLELVTTGYEPTAIFAHRSIAEIVKAIISAIPSQPRLASLDDWDDYRFRLESLAEAFDVLTVLHANLKEKKSDTKLDKAEEEQKLEALKQAIEAKGGMLAANEELATIDRQLFFYISSTLDLKLLPIIKLVNPKLGSRAFSELVAHFERRSGHQAERLSSPKQKWSQRRRCCRSWPEWSSCFARW